MTTEKQNWIKIIYLYLFSLVGLVLIVIGSVRLVDLTLKTFIFTMADEPLIYPQTYPPVPEKISEEEKTTFEKTITQERQKYEKQQMEYERMLRQQEKQRTMANSLAMIIVGLPLFLYHWRIIRKEEFKSKI
jgi:hypothetical protein